MTVVASAIPSASQLDPAFVARACFHDSWSVPLRRPEIGIVAVFAAVFAHHPRWMKLVLIARNRLAALAGLSVPAAAAIRDVAIRPSYAAGETIGVWPIFAIDDREIVAGRDNPHLDFRVSVLKACDSGDHRVVVTTICDAHNLAGRLYLFCIAPFHRAGVRLLLANAVAAGRL